MNSVLSLDCLLVIGYLESSQSSFSIFINVDDYLVCCMIILVGSQLLKRYLMLCDDKSCSYRFNTQSFPNVMIEGNGIAIYCHLFEATTN